MRKEYRIHLLNVEMNYIKSRIKDGKRNLDTILVIKYEKLLKKKELLLEIIEKCF